MAKYRIMLKSTEFGSQDALEVEADYITLDCNEEGVANYRLTKNVVEDVERGDDDDEDNFKTVITACIPFANVQAIVLVTD